MFFFIALVLAFCDALKSSMYQKKNASVPNSFVAKTKKSANYNEVEAQAFALVRLFVLKKFHAVRKENLETE